MTPQHRISTRLAARARTAGFTLIELMIVVVIVTVLVMVAVPTYLNQIRESRRTEARDYLVELASREERYYATQNAYTSTASNLGYGGFGSGNPVGSGYYYITVTVPDPSVTAPSFSLTATPVAGKGQDKDSYCASFTVESNGKRTALNSATADDSSVCWPSQ
ncbi:MAG TPA: type IV pilin protein [Steroidobacteraceae bacterium]|jgi:type IV pilus assembly protein PilE|nr:type IV pilin protein [Steroidobacteraceae bacterium]